MTDEQFDALVDKCEDELRESISRAVTQAWHMTVAAFDAQVKCIAELKAALQFYADCEWGWNGGGDYEPMIMRLPDTVPNTLDCKFAGSVAKAALEEAHDDPA